MVKLVQLPDLPSAEPWFVEFGYEWAELCRMWRMILAMAVRDGAASVHYHPWRADGHLSYLVAGVRYELIPPPPWIARRVSAAAGTIICGNRVGAASRRWLGWPLQAAGQVRLAVGSDVSEWTGVVWSVGSLTGVEWYRLTNAPQPDQPREQLPAASASS